MTAITIRKLPEEAKHKLRLRAAANNRSMEAEARGILLSALEQPIHTDLSWIEQLIEVGNEFGGVDLPVPVRDDEASVAEFWSLLRDHPRHQCDCGSHEGTARGSLRSEVASSAAIDSCHDNHQSGGGARRHRDTARRAA